MVYCGKPSTACGRCRARRLKCDRLTPSCSQCSRARQQCRGYRDLASLAFRNQNEDVVRRARRSRAESSVIGVSRKKERGYKLDAESLLRSELMQVQCLSTPISDQASCFILHNYVLNDPARNYLSYLYPLQKTDESLAVKSAMTALGLAALANIKMAPSVMMAAREEYTSALAYTNMALCDSVLSKGDSTLAAVILLGMYEVMTCSGTASIRRWKNHINGATKLIEWRGGAQLKSQLGMHMFRQIRAQIVINNIYDENYTSSLFAHLSQRALEMSGTTDMAYADHFGNIVVGLGDFCAAIKHGHITDPAAIISTALAFDADLTSWESSIPPSWAYMTVTITPEMSFTSTMMMMMMTMVDGIYGTHYHVYANIWVSSVWNNYRGARFIIHEMILEFLSKEPFHDTKNNNSIYSDPLEQSRLAKQSQSILMQICEEICASAPYHFGASEPVVTTPAATTRQNENFNSSSSSSSSSSASSTPHGQTQPPFGPSVRAAGGYLLMWPLFLAAECKYSPPPLKKWVIACLEKIGRVMGIHQALAMSVLLREGIGVRTWVTGPEIEAEDEPIWMAMS